MGKVVCKEVHDRGLIWKKGLRSRRGQELCLWGVLNAGNYNYIIRWYFRDDGAILGEVGATGTNLPASPFENHTHIVTWRLDVDFGDGAHNSVAICSHDENSRTASAQDTATVLNTERGLVWNPVQFDALRVFEPGRTNNRIRDRDGRDHTSALDLIPLRYGNVRTEEPYTQYDFWITRERPNQMWPRRLPQYVQPAGSIQNSDIIVWYTSPLHHWVRDEDGELGQNNRFIGVTHLMWTGFMLIPRNLFDTTPLY